VTRAHLVGEISEQTGISQKAAYRTWHTVALAVRDYLKGPEAGSHLFDRTGKISHCKAPTGALPRNGRKSRVHRVQVPLFSAAE
jgi:hypothetical protein